MLFDYHNFLLLNKENHISNKSLLIKFNKRINLVYVNSHIKECYRQYYPQYIKRFHGNLHHAQVSILITIYRGIQDNWQSEGVNVIN